MTRLLMTRLRLNVPYCHSPTLSTRAQHLLGWDYLRLRWSIRQIPLPFAYAQGIAHRSSAVGKCLSKCHSRGKSPSGVRLRTRVAAGQAMIDMSHFYLSVLSTSPPLFQTALLYFPHSLLDSSDAVHSLLSMFPR